MKVTNGSVARAGLPRGLSAAVMQYVWNSIEADATKIDIVFERMAAEVKAVKTFYIEDNGTGIDYSTIQKTFGSFLDSIKQTRFTKGGKGKGRLSFLAFSSRVIWYTTFKDKDGVNQFYTIQIDEGERKEYESSDPKPVKSATGTRVEFRLPKDTLDADYLDSEDFKRDLSLEFGWFLQINQGNNLEININGKRLNHSDFIELFEAKDIIIKDKADENRIYKFTANFIQWKDKIGTDSHFYFLDGQQQLKERAATGFNKIGGRAYGFVHSVYVQSDYFNTFSFSKVRNGNNVELDLDSVDNDQHDTVYRQLIDNLKKYVAEKRDEFLSSDSEGAIERFRERGTLPIFSDDVFGKQQQENYTEVLKGVYKTAPTLFIDISKPQEKSLLGLLNLSLQSDEREHVLDILSSVVDLSSEERRELAELLKKTKLSGVIKLLKTLESRYAVVEILKELVFKHIKTTTERGQLQDAIENNFWLFGEEYNLVSADTSFKQLEDIYLNMIDDGSSSDIEKSDRRPDLFLARHRKIANGISGVSYKKQNLIVELKRPSVDIGTEQFRQIEDYRDILRKDSAFNSSMREWHMFIIGVNVKDEVASKYNAFKHLGKQFLVSCENNFYIYALSWDDVFTSFEVRHDFLLDDLDIDKNKILEDIRLKKELNESQVLADETVIISEVVRKKPALSTT
ncbi:ATP-binding protein [Dehalobacter restrictus]|uniref:ATP-binding protein n=1 Tax=Dehalobacter restrictus TaxID=55583 RepID=UPI00339065B1